MVLGDQRKANNDGSINSSFGKDLLCRLLVSLEHDCRRDETDIGDDQHLSGDKIRRFTLDRSRLEHTCQVDTTSNDVSEVMNYRHWLILKLVFESRHIVR